MLIDLPPFFHCVDTKIEHESAEMFTFPSASVPQRHNTSLMEEFYFQSHDVSVLQQQSKKQEISILLYCKKKNK